MKGEFSLFKKMQRVPGGLVVVPMFAGVIINTVYPEILNIGGFTTGLFKTGTFCLLGLFILLNGASIEVRRIGMPLYKGVILTLLKFIIGTTAGLIVAYIWGNSGVFGISPLAIIAALTSSGSGLYLGLAAQFGDQTDRGAISILSLKDGPFLTMVAMGAAGMASIPLTYFIATLIPLILGIIWGNLDKGFRDIAEKTIPTVTFFMMIPIGAGMSFYSLIIGGVAGVVLAIISALSAFVFFILYQFFLPKNKRNAMGAAVGTTAGNAVAIPTYMAEMDKTWAPYAAAATAQCAVAAIITAFTGPIITALCDKYMRKAKKGIYSDEAIRTQQHQE